MASGIDLGVVQQGMIEAPPPTIVSERLHGHAQELYHI